VIVGFGAKPPRGHLPVYSVADEREARRLLVATCPTNVNGEFVAAELAEEQTLDNLAAFSDRLDRAHVQLKLAGQCRCE
jgi:hypothetical protein